VIAGSITVVNRLGLHARASAKLVQLLAAFRSRVLLSYRGREINAKSIMGLMMLAAAKGAEIGYKIEGDDELATVQAMNALFARRFDEDE
jgi:phosphocarrier protein HPr